MLSVGFRVGKIRIGVLQIIAVIFYCIVYALGVNNILSDNYFVGYIAAANYNKNFSPIYFSFGILICIFLFAITEWASIENNIISYTLKFCYWLYCIPVCLFPMLFEHKIENKFLLCAIFYWLFLCIAARFIKIEFKKETVNLSIYVKKFLMLASIIAIIIIIAKSLPDFTLSFSLNEVYDTRADYKTNASDWMTFVKTAFGAYVCPGLLAYFIAKKKKLPVFIFLILQITVYSFAKDKTYLFDLFMAIALGIMGKKIIHNSKRYFNIGIFAFSGINILAVLGQYSNFIFNIVTRRIMVVPSWLNYLYFEFFSQNEKLLWRQDVFIIDKLFVAPYDCSAPLLISEKYLNGLVSNPNAGLLAEAYAQFGLVGIIIYPLLIVVLLNVVNQFYKNAMPEVILMISFSLAFSLSNDTIMSTSFIATMIIVCLYSSLFRDDVDS